jgi:hypothetical protein
MWISEDSFVSFDSQQQTPTPKPLGALSKSFSQPWGHGKIFLEKENLFWNKIYFPV